MNKDLINNTQLVISELEKMEPKQLSPEWCLLTTLKGSLSEYIEKTRPKPSEVLSQCIEDINQFEQHCDEEERTDPNLVWDLFGSLRDRLTEVRNELGARSR